MDYTLTKRLMICFAIGFFVVSFHDSVFAGGSISISWGKDSEAQNTPVAAKDKNQGPPAHAPAHGYRAKQQYRYYPSQSVYYDTAKGLYFYLKGDSWQVGASLPSGLRAGLGDYVSVELDTDKPYVYHAEHAKKYPAKKSSDKTKEGKKGKKS